MKHINTFIDIVPQKKRQTHIHTQKQSKFAKKKKKQKKSDICKKKKKMI